MRRIHLTRFISFMFVFLMGVSSFRAAYAAPQAAPASATSPITVKPIADAYVSSTTPTTNYGTGTTLRVDAVPPVISYLRFNVSGLSGITSAKLRVYAKTGSTAGIRAESISNNNWGETTLVYNTSFTGVTTFGTSPAVKAGTWVSWDVTSYVTGNGMYSFVLTTPNSTAISLASRESGTNAPQLVITTGTAPTPPPTGDWQPAFPIRAAFYYPWFSEAWTQQGIYPYTNYTPKLGWYSSADQTILKKHIEMMQYGNIDAAIASWWGQGSHTDAKIAGLLKASVGTSFRWGLYYENESQGNPTVSQIRADLVYIHDKYGTNPNFLRVNGKFVVFVYADGGDTCGMADRWKQANTVGAYVVLKVFPGFGSCANQPDSWHQYSPAVAADQQGTISYAISPGFWLKGNAVRLARDINRWNQNVKDMVASGAKWQLITTFSEWGEGTIVEPATQWASASGYGQYLDALHANP